MRLLSARTGVIAFLLALGSTCALAAPLQVTLSSNPTTCQSTKITWDTSAGTAPWTITVAPLGHVPISVSIPANYMSGNSWSWDWNVPGYTRDVSSFIVAVSDSTGAVTGTSAMSRLSKAGSCSAPAEHLDFVWFPPSSSPRQCGDWLLTVQEDHGNLGLKMPVDLLILPENDVPTRLRITDAKRSSIDWTVNYARGTNFAIAAFDAGTSGTGGVGGQTYTVGNGRSASCVGSNPRGAVAGLPAASSTAASQSASTAASSPSRMTTSRIPASATASNAKTSATSTAAAKVDAANAKSGSSSGVIGGAIGGVLGALVIVGLVIYFCRKQRNKGPDEYGVYPNAEKRTFFGGFGSGRSSDRSAYTSRGGQGGDFGASTDQQGGISPFVTGRASPWRFSSRAVRLSDQQDMAQLPDDRRAIVNRMNDGPRSMGHSSSVSLHRGRDSFGGLTTGGLQHAPSVHTVVPDEALFPPPMPVNRNMMPNHGPSTSSFGAGVGAGVGAMGMKQHWTRDRSDSGSSYQHQQQRDPFRNPSNIVPSPMKGTHYPYAEQYAEQGQQRQQPQYPQEQQQQQRQHPASRDSMAAIAGLPLSPSSNYSVGLPTRSRDLTNEIPHQDLSTMRIPPPAPISTSLFDPYAHASRLYSDTEITHLNAALANSHDRANAATPTSFTSTGSAPRYADPKESAARFRTLETQLLKDRKKVVSNVYDDSDDEGGLPYMS
ncbi:hypothetical protein EX895_000761 [Sporisorium graminicola]|uniref:Mid2 domain-containing protein n=1 Tax=Sporisorium graminicola TaxID=280036 RepID=A0A4U7L0U7_9BASI|nr:hypothetical protein EX895_000761 [Sporisorium graminicola]TKY90763.1 hypothetical protein EX895_000761 [Sporisorium graminicola]